MTGLNVEVTVRRVTVGVRCVEQVKLKIAALANSGEAQGVADM